MARHWKSNSLWPMTLSWTLAVVAPIVSAGLDVKLLRDDIWFFLLLALPFGTLGLLSAIWCWVERHNPGKAAAGIWGALAILVLFVAVMKTLPFLYVSVYGASGGGWQYVFGLVLFGYLALFLPVILLGFWVGRMLYDRQMDNHQYRKTIDRAKRKIWWKLYVWLVTVLIYLSIAYDLYSVGIYVLNRTAELAVVIFSIVGLFGFAYDQSIFRRLIWQLWLPFIVFWDVWGWYEFYSVQSTKLDAILDLLPYVLLSIPEYIALYLYGYRSTALWGHRPNI